MENMSVFKIVGFVLIISGFFFITYMPKVLERQSKSISRTYNPNSPSGGERKNITKTALYIAGAIDIIVGLIFLSGIVT